MRLRKGYAVAKPKVERMPAAVMEDLRIEDVSDRGTPIAMISEWGQAKCESVVLHSAQIVRFHRYLEQMIQRYGLKPTTQPR
jgi:hypothetical protein